MMKIGLIGIGELGIAIAKNMLKAGHTLCVYDLNREAMERAVELGAETAVSAAQLARSVEVVLTVLPTPPIIEDVLLGNDGVLAAMNTGSCWIDHSTNDRNLLKCIANQAAAKGVYVIEAPVTGGIPLAHAGKITVLAGTDKATFAQYRHLLDVVGEPVIHLGPVGSASIVKVMTNMLAFIHLWALGEGLMMGTAAGLDTGAVYEAIKASCGNSFVAETEGPPILNGNYDYGFTQELAAKDMRLVMQLAQEYGVPLQMGGLVQQLLARSMTKYGPKFWSTGIVKLLEDDMGIDLRASGYEPEKRWNMHKDEK
ncbi:MAG: NAD(P)-dependent oxidoreductase [Chloroflexi bacterium]|nr:NAD(P)-dependent oxidoreductase [Chloroflexota bacterium]